MRIAQVILERAPAFERKLQRLDEAALAPAHAVTTLLLAERDAPGALSAPALRKALEQFGPEVIHVYGPDPLPSGLGAGWTAPWVATGSPAKRRFTLFRAPAPAQRLLPAGADAVPEAVDPSTMQGARVGEPRMNGRRQICSVGRGAELAAFVESVFNRLARFRDDIDWNVYDTFPSNEELDEADVWVDAALDESDRDGFAAEALVRGRLVVASRTPTNAWRLGDGAYGLLVRPGDPNELTHAIAGALFKPETGEELRARPEVHAARFSAAARADRLIAVYESFR